MQSIPLSTNPNENYNITLFLNDKNKTFNLFFSFNGAANYWTMDIRNEKKEPIACNIPLICNRNILEGLESLKIGRAFFIRKTEEVSVNSTIDNLERDYYLLWDDNE